MSIDRPDRKRLLRCAKGLGCLGVLTTGLGGLGVWIAFPEAERANYALGHAIVEALSKEKQASIWWWPRIFLSCEVVTVAGMLLVAAALLILGVYWWRQKLAN